MPSGPKTARTYADFAGLRSRSRDPIGYEGGVSLYRYMEASPINDTDAFGTLSKKECLKKLLSLKIHVEELKDHWSPNNHCRVLRSELERFKTGGCKKWAKSFGEVLEALTLFYNSQCTPPPDDPNASDWEEWWPFGEKPDDFCDRWVIEWPDQGIQSCTGPEVILGGGGIIKACRRIIGGIFGNEGGQGAGQGGGQGGGTGDPGSIPWPIAA